MKKLINSTLIAFICFFVQEFNLNAQSNKMAGLEQGSLNSQFDYAINKSSTHEGAKETFQVIRRTWLYKLKANVKDSVKALQGEIISLGTNVQRFGKRVECC